MIVQRELEKETVLTMVQELSLGHAGQIHIQSCLDQVNGRILVFSTGGARLADMTVGSGKSGVLPGLYMANLRGDMCLSRKVFSSIGRESACIATRRLRFDPGCLYLTKLEVQPTSSQALGFCQRL